MTYNEREVKIKNDEFEGGFDTGTGTLFIGKALSTSLSIPSEIEIDGKKHTVFHLEFTGMTISMKNVSYISFPSTLLTISPSGTSISSLFRDFSGKIDVPSGLECFLDVTINRDDNDWEKIFNKYDNAYYFGNKDNPYAYLYSAINDDITSCVIHKDTQYICSGAFSDCYKLKKILLPDGLLGIGSFAFDYNVIETNEYEDGFYIGSESNPYFAFLFCDEDLDEYHVHEATKCLLEMPQEPVDIYLSSNVTMFPFYSSIESEPYCDNLIFLGQPEGYVLYNDNCLCKKVNGRLLHIIGRMDQRVFDDVSVLIMPALKHVLKEELIIPPHVEYVIDGWYGDEFESIYLSKNNKLHTFVSKYIHRIPEFYYDGSISDYLDNRANYDFVTARQKQYFKNDKGKYDVVKKATISNAQDNCLRYFEDIEEVIMEDGIEEIGKYAFYHCSKLKKVKISSSVKKIGYNAFANCMSLAEIKIPNSVTELDNNLFEDDKSLQKIYLPKSIQKISFGLLGTLPPNDLKLTIYYDGTYEEFSRIDMRDRDTIEKYLECKEMGGTMYDLRKSLREFKYPNCPFKSDKCWWMVYRNVSGSADSKFKALNLNLYKPYVLDNSAKIISNKQPVDDDFIFSLNVVISVNAEVFKFKYDNINQFIVNVLSGMENCQNELNEMNPDDCIDVDEIPIYNFFDLLKDDPESFIKELNAFRSMHSTLPMLIRKVNQYDVAFFVNELLAVSEEDYHNYHSDEEVLEMLKEKNSIILK